MKTIWKYPFKSNAWNTLTMPKGAQVLKLAIQHGRPTIWALVETVGPTEDREFGIFATGEQIHAREGQLRFIDTFFVDDGNYVFHVFELVKEEVLINVRPPAEPCPLGHDNPNLRDPDAALLKDAAPLSPGKAAVIEKSLERLTDYDEQGGAESL